MPLAAKGLQAHAHSVAQVNASAPETFSVYLPRIFTMHRKTLLASALAVLMVGSTAFVMAQDAPPPTPPASAHAAHGKDMHAATRRDGDHGHDMRQRGFDGQRGGVIGDLRGLERLYMQAGRSKELAALYNDVLAKSQDPRVRDYVYQHLARLQARPTNLDQAIATLRKGLDESLANEAKMRAEREQMRAAWQQHHGDDAMRAAQPPAGK
ncbi:hypothetical protein GCM10008098_03310 [Rhodanobacter panaciterrae]|uniref:Protein refolding chaperone Spy/CpxP family n=2 Tax=Rhodanobacter panaciterrae TaxID=490572 RepID=A0ABQ2ZI98_9GAMM|nr:hypothetical protein GCM10008098_03310 [Rhodanobacter panaciterrae]